MYKSLLTFLLVLGLLWVHFVMAGSGSTGVSLAVQETINTGSITTSTGKTTIS
jgi:hypothetical protein